MKATGWLLALAAVIGAWLLVDSAYIVREWEHVVLTEFGKPVVGEKLPEPGLHFKKPFVQEVNRFDRRILEWDGYRKQIPAADKRFIWIDTTARWRIADPLLFLQAVHDEGGAQTRLDDVLDGATRNEIGAHKLIEVARISNRVLDVPRETAVGEELVSPEQAERVEVGRNKIAENILARTKPIAAEKYGIELIDVRIKRINYVENVRRSVYERMISERNRIAEQYRSEGQGKSAEILGKREREELRIRSEAERQAQEVRAKADADAARIYADAYGQDAEFYAFWRSLETYRKVVGGNHTLVISPDSDIYRYLFNATGK